MKREDYIKEAYSIMQDVEEVADLLEEREKAEQKYVQGKSSLARFIILTLYSELTEEDKNGIKRLFGNDVEKSCDKAYIDNREVIANLRAENEHLRNNVSELIEELDASHVFCEGIQEKLNADFRKKLVDTIIYMSNRGIFNQLVKDKASNLDIAECVLQHLDTYANKILKGE